MFCDDFIMLVTNQHINKKSAIKHLSLTNYLTASPGTLNKKELLSCSMVVTDRCSDPVISAGILKVMLRKLRLQRHLMKV